MHAVLICSNYDLGRLILPSLRRIGARCHLICDRRAEHLRLSRCCDGLLLASDDLASERPERVIEVINRLARSEGVDCILASDVDALVLLSGIASQLDCPAFPMPSTDILKRLNNKWQFHNVCRALGLSVPRTQYFSSKSLIDPEEIGASIGFPAVVKPLDKWSGIGVTVVNNHEEMNKIIVDNRDYKYQEVIVQEYIDGKDAGFGGLALDGKSEHWTTFLLHEGGAAEFTFLPELLHAAEKIIAELNFTGIINLDVRIDTASGAVKFLECNPRFFIRVQASRLCGLDFVRAGLLRETADGSQPRSLTSGRYLPLGSLMSRDGWRQIAAGNWSASAALGAFAEMVSDPLPRIADLVRWSAANGPRSSASRFGVSGSSARG